MKTKLAAVLLATAILAVPAGVRASELSMAASPLVKPDSDSVRQALGNLEEIANTQSGNAKVRTQRVATAIRNLFLAEGRVRKAQADAAAADREAKRLERNAASWLKPNVFNRTNPQAARDARKNAARIRARSALKLKAAREHLAAQGRELETVMRNFQDLGDLRLVVLLGEALQTVLARSLGNHDFQLAFPPAALVGLEATIRRQAQWRNLAAEAEKNHSYEVALRYFTMATDHESARRCAAAVVPELLVAGLYGSAIEACQIAGDRDQARRIHAAHPVLRAPAFRKLPPEELLWRVSTSCLRILDEKSKPAGIGFFFRTGGFALTLRQNLPEQATMAFVRLENGRTIKARILPSPESSGLAILHVPVDTHQFLTLARDSEITLRIPAFIPKQIGESDPAALRPAQITDTKALRSLRPTFHIARPAVPGAPVVDDRGRVLGIVLPRSEKNPRPTALSAGAARGFTGADAGIGFSFH